MNLDVITLLFKASAMEDEVIMNKCLQLIDENTTDTFASDSFTELCADVLKTVVSRDTLGVTAETDVWEACIKWAAAECQRQGKEVSLFIIHEPEHFSPFPTCQVS